MRRQPGRRRDWGRPQGNRRANWTRDWERGWRRIGGPTYLHRWQRIVRPAIVSVMSKDIDRIVISRRQIQRRVASLAREISEAYNGHELVIVPVLTGSFVLLADLVRELPLKMRVDVLAVSSYPGRSIRSQGPRIVLPGSLPLAGRRVLILDDVLESGRSIGAVQTLLRRRRPASIKTCVLLRKASAKAMGLSADFIGFEIADDFVVGYGMDFNHYYRNLPDIVTLKPAIFGRRA